MTGKYFTHIVSFNHLIIPFKKVVCETNAEKKKEKYLGIHSEIPVNSLGTIEESIPIIGETAVYITTGIKISTHGFSFPSCLDPGNS